MEFLHANAQEVAERAGVATQPDVVLQVRDPSGYAAPMRLPIRGRLAGGWYPLGPVSVR